MEKEIFQVLFCLALVGIQPVTQAGTAHKWSQQSNIAIMSSIATPGNEGVGNRCERGDQDQPAKAAARKSNNQSNYHRNTPGNHTDTAPYPQPPPPTSRTI